MRSPTWPCCPRNGIELPYADAARMKRESPFHDLATAYFTRAAAQNVRYTEIFFDPQAHTSRGVEFGTDLRGLRRAVVDARRTPDLHASLIICFLRDFSAEYAMATLTESRPCEDWIVGVGLDSDERGSPPVKFEKVFAGPAPRATCSPCTATWTSRARSTTSGRHWTSSGSTGLTVCPLSNSFVRGSAWEGATKRLLDAGVLVSVNSDDPAYFDGYVAECSCVCTRRRR